MSQRGDGPANALVEKFRSLCHALPEVVEVETWGDPTFKVNNNIFAQQKRGDGTPSFWRKAARGAQEILVRVDLERFFVPPYDGHNGWIGVWLDEHVDWEMVADLVADSYVLIAPKKPSAQLSF